MPILLAFVLMLVGCASTEQGKSVSQWQYADMASSAVALSANDAAREANPLGLWLLPLKVGFGWFVDQRPCHERRMIVKTTNPLMAGVVTNNLLIGLGQDSKTSLLAGAVMGIGYYRFIKVKECIEP